MKVLLLLLSLGVLLSYQNCAPTGGESAFNDLSSTTDDDTNTDVDCNTNPSDPACQNPDGGVNPNALSISNPTENPARNSAESTFVVAGTCNQSNFIRNKIFWTIRSSAGAAILSSEDLPQTLYRCVNGQYSLEVPNQVRAGQSIFRPNDVVQMTIQIRGYDSVNIPYANPPGDTRQFNITFLPPGFAPLRPVLNNMAIGSATNAFDDRGGAAPLRWFAAPGQTNYVITNLSGYCMNDERVRTIRFLMEDESFPGQEILLGAVNCTSSTGINPPNPALDGTFTGNDINITDTLSLWPTSPMISARHVKFWLRVTFNGTNYDSEPKVKAQFRFHDGKGGGWTAQAAQEVIGRFKKFAEFNTAATASYAEGLTFANNVRNDVSANTGLGCQGGVGTSAKYGLRCKALEYFNASEKALSAAGVNSIVLSGDQNNGASLLNRLHRVGLNDINGAGGLRCDSSLNLTRYNYHGVLQENGSRILTMAPEIPSAAQRHIQNIALCSLYHRDYTMLGRSNLQDAYKSVLENGLRFRSIAQCRGTFSASRQEYVYNTASCGCYTGPNINDPANTTGLINIETGACVRFLQMHDSAMRQYFNGVQGHSLSLTNDFSDLRIRLFYQALAQKSLNFFFNDMCNSTSIIGSGGDEFVNDVVSAVIGDDMPDKAPYRYLEKTGVSAAAQAFAVYSTDTMCGSRNANGSTISVFGDGGGIEDGGGGACLPANMSYRCQCLRDPNSIFCGLLEP